MPELHLFDFDGTLFRSPVEPLWWPGGMGWWADQRSLNMPCVPDKPGSDWWIGSTVSAAKRSISDSNVYAVMATGRNDKAYRWRVPELLNQKGLRFDEVHLNPGGDTQAWKKGLVAGILRRYPNITKVQIWEDQQSNLRAYEAMLVRAGYEVDGHLVRVDPKEPLCKLDDPELTGPGDPVQVVFTEVALTNPGQLQDWWVHELGQLTLSKLFMHHVTLAFKPDAAEVEALPLGQRVRFKVVGWAADNKAQAVVVRLSGLTAERTPHVTVSTSGVSPTYSNELLARGWQPVDGPTLEGIVGFFDGKEHHFRTADVFLQARRLRIARKFVQAQRILLWLQGRTSLS